MTLEQLKAKFPNGTPDFFRRVLTGSERPQIDYYDTGLRPVQPQPVERVPLGASPQGEETRWYASARRFEIVFTVYSRHPCDWDGYDIKALQDFLIKAGIIPDDGWQTLSGRVVSRKAATQGEERTEIEIRPCR